MNAIALIGAGRIGAIHAANIAAHPRLRLACVVDHDASRARALAERYGAPVVSENTALAGELAKGVVIASPTATHIDYMLAATEAGLAVLCEKPVDLDLARARDAVRVLEARDARVLLGFNRRFDPHVAALRMRLAAGEIGAIESLHIISHDPAPPSIDYVRGSGGLLHDMAIHDLDMARWLLDVSPIGVFASAACLVDPAIGATGDVDTARTILRTADGRLCSISSTRRSGYGYDQRIEIYGARGMLRLDNVRETTVQRWDADGGHADRLQSFFLDRYAAAYAREMAHFADVIEGARPAITPRDGVAALELAEAAVRSLASGRMEAP